jgi:hypothetical protein
MDESERRALIRRYWENTAGDQDQDITHEIYHDDAVLEFPQSGERFEGVASFKQWRSQYPASVTNDGTRAPTPPVAPSGPTAEADHDRTGRREASRLARRLLPQVARCDSGMEWAQRFGHVGRSGVTSPR